MLPQTFRGSARPRLGLIWLCVTAITALEKREDPVIQDSIQSMGWAHAPAPLPLASRPKAFHASVTLDYSECATSSWKGSAVLIHGGQDFSASRIFDELWVYNDTTVRWSQLFVPHGPYGRYGHSLEVLIVEGCPEKVILFGGGVNSNATARNLALQNVSLSDETWVLGSGHCGQKNQDETHGHLSPDMACPLVDLGNATWTQLGIANATECVRPLPGQYVDCGKVGSTNESCRQSGCCWNPLITNPNNFPWCYRPANSNGWAAPPPRIGHIGHVLYDSEEVDSKYPGICVTGGFGNPSAAKARLLVPLNMSQVWYLHITSLDVSTWLWSVLDATAADNTTGIPTPRAFMINNLIADPKSAPVAAGRPYELFVAGGWDGTIDFHDSQAYFLTLVAGKALWASTPQLGDQLPGTIAMADAIYDHETKQLCVFGGSQFPRQDMFWPPVGAPDQQRHFATLAHSVFQSRGAATAIVTKIVIVSKTNVSVRVLVDEEAGVTMSEQGRAPYPRVGQTLSQIGREVLLFGGLAPYSTYFYNSTWFAQFGSGFGLSDLVSWRMMHPEDSLSSPMALHSGAAVVSQSSQTIPSALWHVGGASLTYEPSASLWMYLLSASPRTVLQPQVGLPDNDPASGTLSNRWYRRELRYSGVYGDAGSPGPTELNRTIDPREFLSAVLLSNEVLMVFGGRVSQPNGGFNSSSHFILFNLTHPPTSSSQLHMNAELPWYTIRPRPSLEVPAGTPVSPVPRSCHAATAVAVRPGTSSSSEGMVISGGVSFSCDSTCNCTGDVLNDAWFWHLRKQTWTQLPQLPISKGLYGHAMQSLFVGGRRVLYVFGGGIGARFDECDVENGRGSPWINPLAVSGQLFALDITDLDRPSHQWTLVSVTSASAPGPRFFPAAGASNSKLVFYGGATCPPEQRREHDTLCELSSDGAAASVPESRESRRDTLSEGAGQNGDVIELASKDESWYFQPTTPLTGTWHVVQPQGAFVPLRIGSSAALYESVTPSMNSEAAGPARLTSVTKLLLYGGVGFETSQLDDNTTGSNFVFGPRISPLAVLTLGCAAGHMSVRMMVEPCTVCPAGTYAAQGRQNCTECSNGTTTRGVGAASLADCSACVKGYCHNHGTCAASAGVPSCTCDFLFNDGGRCDGVQNIVLMTLLFAVLMSACSVALYCRKVKKRLRRQSQQNSYYEDVIHDKNEELVQLQAVWKIDPRSIKLLAKVAEGAYGEVSQGLYGSFPCAVKMIRKQLRDFDLNVHTQEFQNEIELLQGLRHANIVFFYGWGVWHDGQTFFVTEYCSRGSLRDVLDDDGIAIPPPLGVRFAHDAAKGMAFLHALDPPRLHRDLKADNVLVSEDWTVKLTDFGSARLLGDADDKTEWQLVPSQRPRSPSSGDPPEAHGDDDSILLGGSMTAALMSSDVGTLLWLAPEVMSRPNGGYGSSAFAVYGKSADVYSFSIVMYEIMTREMPYVNMADIKPLTLGQFAFKEKIQAGLRPRVMEDRGFPGFFKMTMAAAWHSDPQQRPSFAQMVARFANRTQLPPPTLASRLGTVSS